MQPAPPLPPPPFTTLRRVPLAGGTLELVMWEASAVKGQQDRLIRVWTPAGGWRCMQENGQGRQGGSAGRLPGMSPHLASPIWL